MIKNKLELDPKFIPLENFFGTYLKTAKKPLVISLERECGYISVYHTFVHGTAEKEKEDLLYLEKTVKFLLWSRGGYKIGIYGNAQLAQAIKNRYKKGGKQDFDYHFMSRVYEKPFIVESKSLDEVPQAYENPKAVGRHLEGCRIGFDAGGSDRKVSAVIDGKSVYSEEIIWYPKLDSNPDYHYNGILESLKTAASKLPRVDAIGVSSAGIYIDNKTMVASLFIKVGEKDFDEKVKDIYVRAAKEIGEVPLEVANDGDVTALAGAMSLNDTNILGIAMGTSEAVGYVDKDSYITGWLNELAFAPVDLSEEAMKDEWSLDIGVGCKYFSQDAVIKLAPVAGIKLDDNLSLADKLKSVQELMAKGDPRAAAIFRTIGGYLGHTVPLYARFYDIKHILLMGRVTSGQGGNLILKTAKSIIASEYPEIKSKVNLQLPSEKSRRVGQSIAAASLPQVSGGKTTAIKQCQDDRD